jgi:AbrB family looped-hinge helix DNA binding protein
MRSLKMGVVKISPKYQVVIPLEVREALQLKPGQKMQVMAYGNRIEMIPEKNVSEMRGFLKGIKTHFKREPDRA